MKKFLTAVAMAFLLVGCAKETVDLSGINEKLAELDNRVSALEGAITSIQSAIGDGVFVQKAEPYADPETGKTVGITVTYTSGKVVYFEISPKTGYTGPVLGVISNGAGQLVWAVDGVAIKDNKGNEVPVSKTPAFTIDDEGNLLVSIDGGDPVVIGKVQNEGATLVDGIFTDLAVEQDKVVLTLSDNTVVNIPFAAAFQLNIETTEYVFNTLAAIEIPYTVSAKTTGTVVGVAGYNPKDFVVTVEEDKIVVTPLSLNAAGILLAYADSKIGLTSLVNITVEGEGLTVTDEPFSADVDYMAEGENGTAAVHVVSNIPFDVNPVEDWIHVTEVKSQAYVITLTLDDNTTGAVRTGTVNITKSGTETIIQTITIGQDIKVGNAIDLSRDESANSYVVTEAGEYKFKTVKGNSSESVGTVATAEILWETDNTATAPAANAIIASVSVMGDYIVFETPATLKPGNALIAAKDASDVILWSWHIWIPKTEISTSKYGGIVNYPMMDRNLGALESAKADVEPDGKSIGFLYQWGRKDPFPGVAAITGSAPFATNGTITLESAQTNFTFEESIQNPTTYVKTGSDSNKTWMTDEEKTTTAWGAEKTIYDPCPPGYVVTPRDKNNCPLWAKTANFVVDETNKLLKVSSDASSTDFAIFPIGGYLDQGSYSNVGSRMYLWSSYSSSAEMNIAYQLYLNGTSTSVTEQRMSRGGNIRCIAQSDVPEIPAEDPTVDLSKDASANSYIVTEAGDYKFKTVKGNSDESVGTVASAAILWETWNNAEEVTANSVIAQVDVTEGYITFSTPETLHPGNALIAAKDESGVILWSWHIWIPADAITTNTYGLGEVAMMSRNLGALVDANGTDSTQPDITSVGLMYQWGRKDPFMGAGTFFSSTGAHGATTYPVDAFTTSASANVTLAHAIENPTEYAMGSSDSDTWSSETTSAFWGDEKTIYDPCPVGYKVPKSSEVSLLNKGNADIEGWNPCTGFNWFEAGNPASQFVNAGFIEETGLGNYRSPERVIIWSSTAYTDGVRGRCALYNNGSASSGTKQAQARGGVIRCVAE